MKEPIPVTIVSGFLGSGKTTLLCDLLKHRLERRLAVLINELGEVGIDGALAGASADGSDEVQIVDFPQGLIAYAEDTRFVPTLQAIASRRGQIDHVLIETSGVALPSAAMERLQSPELADDFVLDATLVVVDTPRLLAGEFDRHVIAPLKSRGDAARARAAATRAIAMRVDPGGPPCVAGEVQAAEVAGREAMADSAGLLFDQQLAGADVVVLNKIGELDDAALLQAEERVRRRATNVRFIELAHGARLDVRLALGLRLHQVTASARSHHFPGPFAPMPGADSRPLGDHGRVDGHSHSGLLAHSHGLATHSHFHERDPGWLSFTLRCGQRQDVGMLRTALERVAEAEPILRCKGFALSAQEGRPVLLQGVRNRVVSSSSDVPKLPMTGSELVFIGYHPSRVRVAAMLSRLTGTAWS